MDRCKQISGWNRPKLPENSKPWPASPTRWSEEDPDGEFRVSPQDSLAGIIADYEAACEQSREVMRRHGLEDRCRGGGGKQNVRWVLVHMIEETGRHCGHLDILRELLDGSTGD
ncbi:mycothiol transferase [Arthrobacter sp. zg-Y750]|uniref:mycothiol transferase n=1 Tax=Arthrobacter sp. zg-Y750 TaxID=2894189 RepID=UPI001E557C47|nr:DUF664 domain-containing protein [Arthrobacter sp. zg-Y750]MCC9177968.1 DinB family protein [Arthrobacter sp. zg-Y750]